MRTIAAYRSHALIYFGTDGRYVYCIGRRGDLNRDGAVTAADASDDPAGSNFVGFF
ncbi:MAG: hypothetical protein J7J03_03700 [Methanosarcinales archaeon]|nr:hypothetical protein [Methanosarcinales archaeon]